MGDTVITSPSTISIDKVQQEEEISNNINIATTGLSKEETAPIVDEENTSSTTTEQEITQTDPAENIISESRVDENKDTTSSTVNASEIAESDKKKLINEESNNKVIDAENNESNELSQDKSEVPTTASDTAKSSSDAIDESTTIADIIEKSIDDNLLDEDIDSVKKATDQQQENIDKNFEETTENSYKVSEPEEIKVTEKVVEVIEIRELKPHEFVDSSEDQSEYTVIEAQSDDPLIETTTTTTNQGQEQQQEEEVVVVEEGQRVVQGENDNDETLLLIGYSSNDSNLTTTTADEEKIPEGGGGGDDEQHCEEDESSQEFMEDVFILSDDHDVILGTTIDTTTTTTTNATTIEGNKPTTNITQIKTRKPRGRKPIGEIPLHVLGRDISKPTDGIANGGRNLPKPRLGVKVPYRNLTSQIVTKEEIQKEIMDRFKSKQDQNSSSGDIFFARKLTQRLARKLTTTTTTEGSNDNKNDKQETTAEKIVKSANIDEAIIKDNSDLIAILEGDDEYFPANAKKNASSSGDTSSSAVEVAAAEAGVAAVGGGAAVGVVAAAEGTTTMTDKERDAKEREKEIALQQLNELPLTKRKIFRSRVNSPEIRSEKLKEKAMKAAKVETKIDSSINETNSPPITRTQAMKSNKTTTDSAANKEKVVNNPGSPPPQPSAAAAAAAEEEETVVATPPPPVVANKTNQVDIEPQLKASSVLKTYTRKRKSFELDLPVSSPKKALVASNNEQKSDINNTTDVYITKSSRVSKRKVIWDPDEIKTPNKTTLKSPKQTETITQQTTKNQKVIAEKKQENEKSLSSSSSNSSSFEKIPSPIKKSTTTNKDVVVVKKRLSEVDKLLMDEGAVNMIYDVKNTDNTEQSKQKKKPLSRDKAHKELMTKTDAIKNDLQQNVNKQKSLRKKDFSSPPILTRQVLSSPNSSNTTTTTTTTTTGSKKKSSNNSNKSSLLQHNTPPSSPAYSAYSQHAEASRIISRHSSSSFSSSDELILEDGDTAAAGGMVVVNEQQQQQQQQRPVKKKASLLESVKKKIKKTSSSITATATTDVDVINIKSNNKNVAAKNNNNTTMDEDNIVMKNKFKQYKCFKVKQIEKLVRIELDNKNSNSYLTQELLVELTACLKDLSNDKTCQVVSITSNVDTFCRGLEYRSLVSDNENVRKKKATELSNCVKEFLLCLLNFTKILVAGIQGDCLGLGVTMLPLFDMVVTSDVATFSTPYASLGCVPEGGFLLTVPHLTSHGLASELLFTSQVLKADDAFRRGLITRLCWPEKYDEEFKAIINNVANQSMQSTVASKKLLRQNIFQVTETAINNETQILIDHWISAECQNNFNKYKVEVD